MDERVAKITKREIDYLRETIDSVGSNCVLLFSCCCLLAFVLTLVLVFVLVLVQVLVLFNGPVTLLGLHSRLK